MPFESERDVLDWYTAQERILTPDFLRAIPWDDVKKYPLDEKFLPVLVYMRDIEKMTAQYYQELKLTPTWKDSAVREFMDRWSTEEPLHGDLLHRFLLEAGYPASEDWLDAVRKRMGLRYNIGVAYQTAVAHLFGRSFAGVHMTIGAINELTTLTGYQQLWQLAKHPVLEKILRGIAREEARHYFFYWSVARIKLLRSGFMSKLNRYITTKYWVPVGQGIKTPEETNFMVATLFGSEKGLAAIDEQVNEPTTRLPGFDGFRGVSERIRASLAMATASQTAGAKP